MRIVTYAFLLFTCLSCSSRKQGKLNLAGKQQSILIFPGKGIGDLILNKSLKKDIDKYIGPGKKVRYSSSFSNHTTVVTKLTYPEIGVELEYSDLSHPKDTDTLKLIRLVNPCSFETVHGIKIGATRGQVENHFGKPKVAHYDHLINGVYHAIRYDEIEFIFNNKANDLKDVMDNRVSEIILWKQQP